MRSLVDCFTSSATTRRGCGVRRVLVFALPLFVLLAGCTSETPAAISADGVATPETESPVTESPVTESPVTESPVTESPEADAPDDQAPVTNTPEAEAPDVETAVEADAGLPECEDVPTFQSADTVFVTCLAGFAVSPELFASNAGWHLFAAQDGAWTEVDYARTCCEADDPSFTQLLRRNELDDAAVAEFCAGSGLANDPFSGCSASGQDGEDDVDFDGTWLRVNGLGEHDFATADQVVLSSIEQVFGPADAVVEASECGAGPMTIASFDDFTVQFQDGEFIGWYYESSSPALSTPSGVMVGISESDLVVVYQGVEIRNDTLGREFFFEVPAGFMGGFISETDATVTALYAGTTCFFR